MTKEYIISTIKTHKPEFSRLGVRDIGLFGSYVRNQQSPKSDIDILIDFYPEEENFNNFMSVCELIEKILDNKKVDIVTKNGLSPYIGTEILNEVQYV